jgi:hypothetical protein
MSQAVKPKKNSNKTNEKKNRKKESGIERERGKKEEP